MLRNDLMNDFNDTNLQNEVEKEYHFYKKKWIILGIVFLIMGAIIFFISIFMLNETVVEKEYIDKEFYACKIEAAKSNLAQTCQNDGSKYNLKINVLSIIAFVCPLLMLFLCNYYILKAHNFTKEKAEKYIIDKYYKMCE